MAVSQAKQISFLRRGFPIVLMGFFKSSPRRPASLEINPFYGSYYNYPYDTDGDIDSIGCEIMGAIWRHLEPGETNRMVDMCVLAISFSDAYYNSPRKLHKEAPRRRLSLWRRYGH